MLKNQTASPDDAPPLQFVKGIGPARVKALAEAGFRTPESLFFHLPWRYEDRRADLPIEALIPGAQVALRAAVAHCRVIRTRRRGLTIVESHLAVRLSKGGQALIGATFYNQPWLGKSFTPGRELFVWGRLERDGRPNQPSLKFMNPEIELSDGVADAEGTSGIHAGRIVPVYHRFAEIAPRKWREILHHLLPRADSIPDPLNPLAKKLTLPPLAQALRAIHAPENPLEGETIAASLEPARRRLAFDELFFLQAGLLARRERFTRESGPVLPAPATGKLPFTDLLPFELTGAQKKALVEINGDVASGHAMHRLLQGDVGSGKTAVALLTALRFAKDGKQSAIMAPTELLARQHLRTFQQWVGKEARVGFLSGELTAAERRQTLKAIASGWFQIVLGTHALFQEKVEFQDLAFAVIDEQHRFGVEQRLLLKEKGKSGLHMLVMSATPIPRSITLTLFGDLDLTLLDEKPPGRGKVVTAVRSPAARGKVDQFLETEMAAGRQVYVVYPAIEESALELKTVTEGAEELRRRFPRRKVGLLHGKLKEAEKTTVMLDFAAGKLDLLAATTVIEVGIDVPNATVMCVEHAERFGLSQLHQLRGRVGRGGAKSWCILLPGDEVTEEGRVRLEVMEQTDDGFRIAEEDLRLRGPGEMLGTKQSGVPEIKIADLSRDLPLLEKARASAIAYRAGELPFTPTGKAQIEQRLRDLWGDRLDFAHSG